MRVMDEWIRTVVGGAIGGGIAAMISWLKYRDERRDRLRDAYYALFVALEAFRTSAIYHEIREGRPHLGPDGAIERLGGKIREVKAACVRVEFLERSETCLANLSRLYAAAGAVHAAEVLGLPEIEQGVSLDVQVQQAHEEARTKAGDNLRSAWQDMMREAKLSIDRL